MRKILQLLKKCFFKKQNDEINAKLNSGTNNDEGLFVIFLARWLHNNGINWNFPQKRQITIEDKVSEWNWLRQKVTSKWTPIDVRTDVQQVHLAGNSNRKESKGSADLKTKASQFGHCRHRVVTFIRQRQRIEMELVPYLTDRWRWRYWSAI